MRNANAGCLRSRQIFHSGHARCGNDVYMETTEMRTFMQLPLRYKERMQALLKEEYKDYEACFGYRAKAGLRVNTNKISPQDFLKKSPFSLSPVTWTEKGFYYEEDVQPAKHPYYYAGLYYLQEPSAMIPASVLPVTPGDKVLDLCAAPGGKSTELASKLQGEGVLVSNDISPTRAKALAKNMQMAGVPNAVVLSENPQNIVPYFPEYFDKILVDAPCSGEGMFRKENKMMAAWEEHGPEFFAPLQREILESAIKMLKKGGMMVYSTCTFSPEEDEGTVAWLLEKYPEISVVKTERLEGFSEGRPEWIGSEEESLRHCIRIWPHKVEGEGHFVALLKKEGDDGLAGQAFSRTNQKQIPDINTRQTEKKSGKRGRETQKRTRNTRSVDNLSFVKEFLGDTNLSYKEEQLLEAGGCCYLVPEGVPDLQGLRMVESGLLLGGIEKGRFEPYQAFANRLTKELYANYVDFSVDDVRVIKYLKGETVSIEDTAKKGWVLVMVDGYALGWAKASGGMLKNKYFSSWRML